MCLFYDRAFRILSVQPTQHFQVNCSGFSKKILFRSDAPLEHLTDGEINYVEDILITFTGKCKPYIAACFSPK